MDKIALHDRRVKASHAERLDELATALTPIGFSIGRRDDAECFSPRVVWWNGHEVAGSEQLLSDYLIAGDEQPIVVAEVVRDLQVLNGVSADLLAAIELGRRGFAVFPVWPGDHKSPANGGNGCTDATKDADGIRALWDGKKCLKIGIEAKRSGMVFLDVDKSPKRNGAESLSALEAAHGSLPQTREVDTPSGGRHYYFRRPEGMAIKNCKDHPSLGAGLEIKAENQYVVAPPSVNFEGKAYQWVDPSVPIADFPAWLAELTLVEKPKAVKPPRTDEPNFVSDMVDQSDGDAEEKPWDRYNREATQESVTTLLVEAGWTPCDNGRLTRPGKDSGVSGSVHTNAAFHCFTSSNELFEGDGSYDPFGVYARVRHNGDFTAAGRALAAEYGMVAEPVRPLADVLAMIEDCREQREAAMAAEKPPAAPGFTLLSVSDLRQQFPTERIPIIDGLLRRGETMNIIGAAKSRKTWLLMSLMLSVASGREWMGHTVRQGKVLHFDNELHGSTLNKRINKVAAGMGLTDEDYSDNYRCCPLRGQLLDIADISQRLTNTVKAGEYSLIVIDALYKALPDYVENENDNRGITRAYCELDQLAERMGCAIIVIHFQSKGKQNEKKISDIGSGAGAQSRSVDCHLVIREHKEADSVVMEAVARDFPPSPPVVLRWNYPIYTADYNANPALLKDLATEVATMPLIAFVDRCVGPDWAGKVQIEAKAQKAGISLREAARLLGEAIRDDLLEVRGGSGRVAKEYRAITTNNEVAF